jgi:H+/Cl- antiporter ClcA
VFPGAQGSGIPQTIAALHMHDQEMVDRMLSLRIAIGKVLLAPLVPAAPTGAMILLGMTVYFPGVVQAPITSAVIVMEMTANQRLMIPLMATAFLSFAVSCLVCRRPLHGALARRFLQVQEGAGRDATV